MYRTVNVCIYINDAGGPSLNMNLLAGCPDAVQIAVRNASRYIAFVTKGTDRVFQV